MSQLGPLVMLEPFLDGASIVQALPAAHSWNETSGATLTTWKALRVCLLLCILVVLSLTLTRELGSFSRLMISAFGSSVLLLLSEQAGQFCLDLQKDIVVLEGLQ